MPHHEANTVTPIVRESRPLYWPIYCTAEPHPYRTTLSCYSFHPNGLQLCVHVCVCFGKGLPLAVRGNRGAWLGLVGV